MPISAKASRRVLRGVLWAIAASLLAATGNLYAGLIYPIVVALITVVVGGLYIKESRHVRIWDEVGGHHEDQPEAEVAPGTGSPVVTA